MSYRKVIYVEILCKINVELEPDLRKRAKSCMITVPKLCGEIVEAYVAQLRLDEQKEKAKDGGASVRGIDSSDSGSHLVSRSALAMDRGPETV